MMLALLGHGAVRIWTGARARARARCSTWTPCPPRSTASVADRLRALLPVDARLRRGLRRDDRHRGDLERRSPPSGHPAQKNAAVTLGWMVGILAVFFLGVSFLAQHYAVMPTATRDRALATRPSRLRRRGRLLRAAVRHVRGPGARGQHRVRRLPAARQHPRERRFMPTPARGARRPAGVLERHHPSWRSSRCCWSGLFDGDTNALVPLYAIGVFVCFTLSQAGMVVHWLRSRATRGGAGRRRSTASARWRRRSSRSSRWSTKFAARRLDHRADHPG